MAAQKYGEVDPTNYQAVEDFFVKTFPKLSKNEQQPILKFLLGHDGPAKIPPDCNCSSCVKRKAAK